MFNGVSAPRGAMGYCFVEMPDEATAERCLRKINGKSLPGASPVQTVFIVYVFFCLLSNELLKTLNVNASFSQPTRFKLNRATFGKQETG